MQMHKSMFMWSGDGNGNALLFGMYFHRALSLSCNRGLLVLKQWDYPFKNDFLLVFLFDTLIKNAKFSQRNNLFFGQEITENFHKKTKPVPLKHHLKHTPFLDFE